MISQVIRGSVRVKALSLSLCSLGDKGARSDRVRVGVRVRYVDSSGHVCVGDVGRRRGAAHVCV